MSYNAGEKYVYAYTREQFVRNVSFDSLRLSLSLSLILYFFLFFKYTALISRNVA